MLLGPAFREFKSELQDAVHTVAENTACCVTIHARFRRTCAATDEYSPSLFSRTTQKSMSPVAVGQRAFHAGISRTGRSSHTGRSRAGMESTVPQRNVIGILAGQPTAPK